MSSAGVTSGLLLPDIEVRRHSLRQPGGPRRLLQLTAFLAVSAGRSAPQATLEFQLQRQCVQRDSRRRGGLPCSLVIRFVIVSCAVSGACGGTLPMPVAAQRGVYQLREAAAAAN